MSATARIRLAATLVFLAIALGAFGAHGLAERLEETGRLENWETATLYHLVHGLALFVIALQPGRPFGFHWFVVGIILFSGSLYALALSDIARLGAITPFGGVAFLIGWGCWIFSPTDKQSGIESPLTELEGDHD
ncbi:MAG: DUF423 domain-containing protein [Verrucomicrobiota bacterium]